MAAPTQSMTMKKLAQHAGVSVQTVSRYINKGCISKKTADKVQKSIEKFNYYPSAIGQSLVKGKTNIIGIAIYHSNYIEGDTHFSSLLSGVIESISNCGYSVQLLETCPEAATANSGTYYLDKLRSRAIDGLIINDDTITDAEIIHLHSIGIPFVIVDRIVEQIPGKCVVEDSEANGYQLAKFLLGRGHHRIAYFGLFPNSPQTVRSLQGVYRAFNEHKANIDNKFMYFGPNKADSNVVNYLAGMAKILTGPNSPSAAICPKAFLTEHLIKLLSMGLKVQEEFEFAAQVFKSDWISCKHCVYTVGSKSKQLGYAGGKLLMKLVSGQTEPKVPVVMPEGSFLEPKFNLSAIIGQD